MLTSLDHDVLMAINAGVGHVRLFDQMVLFISEAQSLKLAPLLALVIGLWFADCDLHRRGAIFAGIGGAMAALLVGRILQKWLPLRPRPVHSLADLRLPHEMRPIDLIGDFSSFPSDHAILAFAIATIVVVLRPRLGVFALLWAAVIVALPRVYLGLHYPSDVLAGAAIGGLVVVAAMRLFARPAEQAVILSYRRQAFSVPAAFLMIFMLGTMFDDVRHAGSIVKDAIWSEKAPLSHPAVAGRSPQPIKVQLANVP